MSGVMMDPLGAVGAVLGHLEDVLAPPAPDETTFYAWHPLPLGEWFRGMAVAQDYLIARNCCWTGQESFLDTGSGLGTKLALAQRLGWQPHGIERWPGYVQTSRRLFPDIEVELATAADYQGYDRFDLVYSYRLCLDLDDQRRLTELIVSRMRPCALLFLAGGPDPVLRQVGPSVWEV